MAMASKRSSRSSKAVKTLKSKSLTAKKAAGVKGGIIAVLKAPNATINWGDGTSNTAKKG